VALILSGTAASRAASVIGFFDFSTWFGHDFFPVEG
jgi:hypothetical protein